MAAAMAGGKSKKKKWSKGKVREKVANKVLFDDETYTRFLAEIPKARRAVGPRIRNPLSEWDGRDQRALGQSGLSMRAGVWGRLDTNLLDYPRSRHYCLDSQMKLITPSALVERLKINGALARAAIKELQEKGMIKMVSYHHTQWIFTRDVAAE